MLALNIMAETKASLQMKEINKNLSNLPKIQDPQEKRIMAHVLLTEIEICQEQHPHLERELVDLK